MIFFICKLVVMKRSIILFLSFFILVVGAKSQSLDIGIGVGGSLYWGDLNSESFGINLGNTNIAVQVNANYVMSDYISIRGGLLYGTLSGDDSKSTRDWQRLRNLNFKSTLIEASIMGELHIFGYNKLGEDSPFSPFVTVGLSGFYYNPTTVLDGQEIALQPLGTEGQGLPGFGNKYNKFSGAITFGAGVKMKLSESVTLVVDGIARRTFTDYLDDISGNYVSYPELAAGNGEIAARLGNRMAEFLGQGEPVILETGSQRGGVNVQDYFFTGKKKV